MRVYTLFFVLLTALLCGCASDQFVIGHGDVGRFIMQQAIIRGGTPMTTNGLPAITTQWRYATDKYGVVIRMPRDQDSSVEEYLRRAFGKPGLGPVDSSDGGRLVAYRLTTTGGGIQYVSHTNWTQVTIVRPMSQPEWNAEVMPQASKR